MMKTFLLFAVFGIAAGVRFQYNSTDPCVMMDVQATFTTTASQGGNQLATASVKSSDTHSVTGSCGQNQAKLIINFNKTGASWTLLFSKKSDSMTVALDMMFHYDAKNMFPKKNLTAENVIQDDEGKETLSKSDQSFVCDAQKEIKFNSTAMSNITYTVVLTLEKLHVQAFNLSKGAYSKNVEHCEEDGKSTSEAESTSSEKPSSSGEPSTSEKPSSSGEPSTSEKPSSSGEPSTSEKPSSSEEPSTSEEPTTSEAPSSTTRPIPQFNQYQFSNGTETCIRMDAGIQLTIMYETKDNKTKPSEEFAVPKNYTLDGMCDTDGNASLTINFDNNSVTFEFTDVSDTASIKSIMFSVVQDSVRFPDAKKPGTRLEGKVDPSQIATTDTTFYTCEDGEPVTFDDNSEIFLSNLKWQAFNLDDGNFTKQGAQCKEDVTTTASSSSVATTTTPKPQPRPVVNNFTVSDGNTTCLVMKAALVLNIPYTAGKENKTVQVVVPELKPSAITGSCGDTEDSVTFSFFQDWSITMAFSVDKSSSLTATTDTNHQLSNVTINYVLDSRFPNASKPKEKMSVMAINVAQFDASQKGSYKCNANVTITAEHGVELITSNFQYKAFQTGNSTTFSNDGMVECPADTETNSIVPIAVGAALAGLVVIVLIAYLIGRRKRQSGYESV